VVGLCFEHEVLGEDEDFTGIDEGTRCGLLANTYNQQALLTYSCGQPGVVAVAGNEAKPAARAAVQDVHGVNDHGAVSGVLADGIAELLDGLNGVHLQGVFPPFHGLGGPVAVDTADGDETILAGFSEYRLDQGWLGVIAIDEQGDLPAWYG
jgi:hypothetical protein